MEPFKNLLGLQAAEKIGKAIHRSVPGFSTRLFMAGLEKELAPLELKARMLAIKKRIESQLSPLPKESFPQLVGALKQNDNDSLGISGFLVWPLTQFVADLGQDHFETSMSALKEMTKVFTAEFAVRPFFHNHEEKTLKQFITWSSDKNEHVRRLVSEGSRPFLPWGQKLPRFAENPELTWPLLVLLKDDESKYVQKSVANHMNDLSKEHPDWLVQKLKGWPNPWVVRHGTRTLIKKGHGGALRLQGVSQKSPDLSLFKLKKKKLQLGDALEIHAILKNKTTKELKTVVDVSVGFLKANGKHSEKVFKGKNLNIKAGETDPIEIRIPLKKVTTRKYYFGKQYCCLTINGKKTKSLEFYLSDKRRS